MCHNMFEEQELASQCATEGAQTVTVANGEMADNDGDEASPAKGA
jgi:hypothetical protein